MPIINLSNPVVALIALILFILILFLSKETKKAWIMGIVLFTFLAILLGYTVEFAIFNNSVDSGVNVNTILISAAVAFAFIFLSFISYLWMDQREVDFGKKKSIDNSLDWFWKKI